MAVSLAEIEISKDSKDLKEILLNLIKLIRIVHDIKSSEDIGNLNLLEKIKRIDSWGWYLECDRKGLAELIKEKFDIKISTAQLKKLWNYYKINSPLPHKLGEKN